MAEGIWRRRTNKETMDIVKKHKELEYKVREFRAYCSNVRAEIVNIERCMVKRMGREEKDTQRKESYTRSNWL